VSDYSCPVVRLGEIKKHPNADTLSIVEVEGCPVIIRTVDFKEGDVAVFLPIESLIPEDKAWVKKHCSHLKFKGGVHRLRASRLRGVFSMGMVVPVEAVCMVPGDKHVRVGEDAAAVLGVAKYEEPEDAEPVERAPKKPTTRWGLFKYNLRGLFRRLFRRTPVQKPRLMPVYEVANYRKSRGILEIGEDIVVTEKIHGCNAALCFTQGQLFVSSHRVLRRIEDQSIWWRAARLYGLEEKLKQFPDHAFYGEVYGTGVQDMTYDIPEGNLGLRFFDVMRLSDRQFLPYDEAREVVLKLGLMTVPEVYRGAYYPEAIEPLSDGKSTIASHFREGIVIRATSRAARVVLKLVGETYLLRKNGTEKH
jgi:hypothetical protein